VAAEENRNRNQTREADQSFFHFTEIVTLNGPRFGY